MVVVVVEVVAVDAVPSPAPAPTPAAAWASLWRRVSGCIIFAFHCLLPLAGSSWCRCDEGMHVQYSARPTQRAGGRKMYVKTNPRERTAVPSWRRRADISAGEPPFCTGAHGLEMLPRGNGEASRPCSIHADWHGQLSPAWGDGRRSRAFTRQTPRMLFTSASLKRSPSSGPRLDAWIER